MVTSWPITPGQFAPSCRTPGQTAPGAATDPARAAPARSPRNRGGQQVTQAARSAAGGHLEPLCSRRDQIVFLARGAHTPAGDAMPLHGAEAGHALGAG